VHRQTAFAVVLIFLLAPPAGAAELTVTAGDRVHAGDVVHVRGKGAFARGTRYSFFVGGAYASWRRLDDDTGVLVVPAGAAQGRQWLSYTPRLTDDATGATGIARIDVQPERRETIAAKTARFSNEHSAVAAGAMRIEGRAIDRPATITLRQLRSDSETAFFRSTIVAGFDRPEPPLPPLSFDDVFSIEAAGDARVTALAVAVPAEWLESLPPELEPELYVDSEQHGANDELIPQVEPLGARWTAATRELRAQPETPLHLARNQELTVYLGVRRKESTQ
jgi:hypothetical protein